MDESASARIRTWILQRRHRICAISFNSQFTYECVRRACESFELLEIKYEYDVFIDSILFYVFFISSSRNNNKTTDSMSSLTSPQLQMVGLCALDRASEMTRSTFAKLKIAKNEIERKNSIRYVIEVWSRPRFDCISSAQLMANHTHTRHTIRPNRKEMEMRTLSSIISMHFPSPDRAIATL